MESLNYYASDGESDSSLNMAVSKKTTSIGEVDANCEPVTMDMSEESSSGHSDGPKNENIEKSQSKRYYSRSLSSSPATSYSSQDSSDSIKRRKKNKSDEDKELSKRSSSERSKSGSIKDRHYDDERRKYNREYKRDDDRDRKRVDRRDKYSERDDDKYNSKRQEKKRSHRSKSRSPSSSKNKKRKNRSRSRSRSYDRYQRRISPRRSSYKRRSSPYRSRRSRSKSPIHEKPRSHDWKSSSKLKVLEKLGIELKVPVGGIDTAQGGNSSVTNNDGQLTPQLLLQKTMEKQVEKVKSATGIALPSYYNPMAVNPSKYAEQIQKRRLLWGNKDKQNNPTANEETITNKEVKNKESKGPGTIWQGATFGGDQDGKITAKFQRLMGIKNVSQDAGPTEVRVNGSDLIKKQEEMFHSMESQYEVARLATHSHRGLGLGFGTFQPR